MRAVGLPKTVRLPGGYVVKVKLVSEAKIRSLYKGSCGHCERANPHKWKPSPIDAYWEEEDMTIYVRDNASKKDTVWFFKHELLHATWDWMERRYEA